MCFSATGSFAAAGILSAIGSTSLAQCGSRPLRMVAAVPLLFAIQQAAEGVVWLTLGEAAWATLQQASVLAFLGVALAVWPWWLPVSLLRAEPATGRRRILLALACLGGIVSAYAAVLLVAWHPHATTAGHSIRYVYLAGPDALSPAFYLAAYAIPTVAPFFFSSVRMARVMGVALLVSLYAAIAVEREALTSVWCFFAALLSAMVLAAVVQEQRVQRAALAVP